MSDSRDGGSPGPRPRARALVQLAGLAVVAACALAGCGKDSTSPPPGGENRPPTAAITSPGDGASFEHGQPVALAGTASDPEDGALTGSALAWSSSLDGPLGTGASVTAESLAVGDHLIRLTATDADGASARDSVTVHVTATGPVIVELEWVPLADGIFTMGSPDDEPGRDADEGPAHEVSISAFQITSTEVTATHYARWLTSALARGLVAVSDTLVKGSSIGLYPNRIYVELGESRILYASGAFAVAPGAENRPALRVTWYGADAFSIDQGWRLPTEAEWEYACRAGSTTEIYNGSLGALDCAADPGLEAIAWYCGDSGGAPHEVKLKAPNAIGLYDLSGNAIEWVNDWYGRTYYDGAPGIDPPGPATGTYKVARGGDWESHAKFCRSASRVWRPPDYLQSTTYGFRPARASR